MKPIVTDFFCNYDTFLFDFDGVLADTSDFHTKALAVAIRAYMGDRVIPFDEPQVHEYINSHGSLPSKTKLNFVLPLIMNPFLNLGEFVDKDITGICKLKNEYVVEMMNEKLVPDQQLGRILWHLSSYRPTSEFRTPVKLGVVTNANSNVVKNALTKMNIQQYFDIVVGNDTPGVQNNKPFPDPYVFAMECLHSHPDFTVVFEDSEEGIESATTAKVGLLVRINNSHHLKSLFLKE